MNAKLLMYRGYSGSIEIDDESDCLFGRVLYINDLVNYEGSSVPELRSSFEAAVEDYLQVCKERGKAPDKPLSGTFNVRVGPEIHQNAALAAKQVGISLNEFVKRALATAVEQHPAQLSESSYAMFPNYFMPSLLPTGIQQSSIVQDMFQEHSMGTEQNVAPPLLN